MASDDHAEEPASDEAAAPRTSKRSTDSPSSSDAARPTAPKPGTSTAKSRAARRKVALPAGTAPAPPPRKVTKPPFYRRGGFWMLVILAEVLIALLISYRYEPSITTVDLAGADVPTFCATIQQVRAAGDAESTIDVATADVTYRHQLEAYQKLKQSAPSELQPDLDRLIKSSEQLIAVTQEIQRRKAENPAYVNGVSDLVTAQTTQDQRQEVPNARLAVAARTACNIELTGPAPSTSSTIPSPPSSPAPGQPSGQTPGQPSGGSSVPAPPGSEPAGSPGSAPSSSTPAA